MNSQQLYEALLNAADHVAATEAVEAFVVANPSATWVPFGGRENNRGTVEVSGNPGRALAERVTNAVDAILEAEHALHNARPVCRTPREAASAWLNVPEGGLSEMTNAGRRTLSKRVTVVMEEGSGVAARIVTVRDDGIGIAADDMPTTILSLNESNKLTKGYLAGTYGQGGSATLASSQVTLVASRADPHAQVGFTIVKFTEPPPDQPKIGRYEYLTLDDSVLRADGDEPRRGTVCRHLGYDLTKIGGAIGPNSVYGMLQQVLFDPVLPLWFDNRVHDWRRVIKGSRNALNGAVDEGDEDAAGFKLAHSQKMVHATIADLGRVGFEYWLLSTPEKKNKRPTAGYVDPNKPIILTLNGQNQEELTATLIRKDAELPYLMRRLICHVNCNGLTPAALRGLLTSTREAARAGFVLDAIRDELVRLLKSDDDLKRLNDEAKRNLHREQDELASKAMRKEVAKLLRAQGIEVMQDIGPGPGEGKESRSSPPGPGPRPPKPIELRDPPTFIRLVRGEDKPIRLHPEQRRYVHVETDAQGSYHDAKDPTKSRVNVIVQGEHLSFGGSGPLEKGRMRLIVACSNDAQPGGTGTLRIELARPGLPTLSDGCDVEIVPPPPAKPGKRRIVLPPFRVVPVEGPETDQWQELGWPDDIRSIASSAERDSEELVVYYSQQFPNYTQAVAKLEAKDPATAASFTNRYETWLAAHSLILEEDQETAGAIEGLEEEAAAEVERRERRRIAVLSAFFAVREAEAGLTVPADDE